MFGFVKKTYNTIVADLTKIVDELEAHASFHALEEDALIAKAEVSRAEHEAAARTAAKLKELLS